MNSNYSLRFPRSYREATGNDCKFEKRDPDRIVFIILSYLAVFVVGLLIGGM